MENTKRTRQVRGIGSVVSQLSPGLYGVPAKNSLFDLLNSLNFLGGVDFNKRKYTDLLPAIDRLIYSGNKTIIIWEDGDKTIVSCGEGEDFDHYTGFCAAVVKKVFGSTTAAKKVMNNLKKDC